MKRPLSKALSIGLGACLGCLPAGGIAHASELRFQFQNPGFGGNPLGSTYYLSMLESQKRPEEDTSSALDQQNAVQDFAESLKSRILSAVASKITQDIFGNDATTGKFTIDDLLLDYQVVGDEVVINLTDGVSNTTITVPRFSQ
jgi:curli production assembly/transport component CsgF